MSSKLYRVLTKKKENTGIRFNEPATNHPRHDDEQQPEAAALLLQQQLYGNTQSSSSGSILYAYKTDFLDCSGDTIIIIVHVFTLVVIVCVYDT